MDRRRTALACFFCVFILALCVVLLSQLTLAQTNPNIPRVIRFNGRLANLDGTPRVGTVGITFSIYADDKTTAPLWQEVQNVVVDETGQYAVLLGAARSEGLPSELFATNDARWLGIRVENEQERPRWILAAVPYALKAADAETLGGKPLSAFVLNETAGGSGAITLTTTTGATTTADNKNGAHTMSLSGSPGNQNQVAKWTDDAGTLGNSVISDTGSGVGVNTTSPFFPLSVIETSGSKGGLLVGADQGGNMFTIDSSVGGGLANLVGGAYWNGSGHVYGGSRGASRLYLDDGQMHLFVGGASGTAGNGVAWNELVTLSSSGNVGITNTNPQTLLEVGAPGVSSNQIRISGQGPNGIEFMNWDGSTAANLFFRTGLQNLQIENSTGGATPMMSFGIASGNVGIGTNNPTQKLDVAGNINASGDITAMNLSGNGSGLTNLSLANITGTVEVVKGGTGLTSSGSAGRYLRSDGTGWTSATLAAADLTGTVADARLSTNVALKNMANSFTAAQTISSAGTALTTSGGGTGLYASGSTYGVRGSSTSGYGVYGAGGGSGYAGVYGISSSTGDGVAGSSVSHYGVYGSSDFNHGVSGTSGGSSYAGVYGSNYSGGYGVWGAGNGRAVQGTSTGNYGVYGSSTAVGSSGVYGTSNSSSGYGVHGSNTGNGDGVYGTSGNGHGVMGISAGSNSAAVYGYNSGSGYGVYGASLSGYAGYFSGDVNIGGTLSKAGGSFRIDHPLDPANKYLLHSFVESPDMMNIYNGNVVTDASGLATVELPDWFEALNRDFRYQLTVIGQFAQAIVFEKVRGNRFTIKTDKPAVEVSWQVTGIRKDAWANNHRIKVEEPKPANEAGLYIYPQGFGQPAEKAISKVHAPEPPRAAAAEQAAPR